MKLVTFSHRGRTSIGKVEGTRVIDLAAADPALPATLRGLLACYSARATSTPSGRRPTRWPTSGWRRPCPIPANTSPSA